MSDIHIIPEFDGEPVHDESPRCWCHPECIEVNEETGIKVWSHRRPE